jgi:hypothetical protein
VDCALFGSAAWKCAARDAWIGWDRGTPSSRWSLRPNRPPSISRNPLSPAATGKKRERRKETKSGNLLEGPDQHLGEALCNLYDFCVHFGNNLAERNIRGMVVQ